MGAVVQAACVDSRPEHTLVLCALDQEALDGYLAAPALVERFDIELYSDFSAKRSNFIRLVLFCTNAKFARKYSLESS